MAPDNDLAEYGYVIFPFLGLSELGQLRALVVNSIRRANFLEQGENTIAEDEWREFLLGYSSSTVFSHSAISSKDARLLNPVELSKFMSLDAIAKLRVLIGEFKISDEENIGRPEVYWRLVRPNCDSDVGPLHADGWFWACNPKWQRPSFPHRRWKIWASLETATGESGFKLISGSHRRTDIRYEIRHAGSKLKPSIIDPTGEWSRSAVLAPVAPGEAILFDDLLVHGGAVTRGLIPRVSIEFTCFVPTASVS